MGTLQDTGLILAGKHGDNGTLQYRAAIVAPSTFLFQNLWLSPSRTWFFLFVFLLHSGESSAPCWFRMVTTVLRPRNIDCIRCNMGLPRTPFQRKHAKLYISTSQENTDTEMLWHEKRIKTNKSHTPTPILPEACWIIFTILRTCCDV